MNFDWMEYAFFCLVIDHPEDFDTNYCRLEKPEDGSSQNAQKRRSSKRKSSGRSCQYRYFFLWSLLIYYFLEAALWDSDSSTPHLEFFRVGSPSGLGALGGKGIKSTCLIGSSVDEMLHWGGSTEAQEGSVSK